MKLTATIGPPASGKTTWAEQQKNSVNLNRDTMRRALFNFDSYKDYKFKPWQEGLVTQSIEASALEAKRLGKNIIISDTNLNPHIRDKWKNWAKENGYEYEEKVFNADLDILIKRDGLRSYGFGYDVITSMKKKMVDQGFTEYPKHQHYDSLEEAVLFDIDGTLALMDGRKPFDWHRVDEDKPNKMVIDYLRYLHEIGYIIIIMSGRDGSCRDLTEEWLDQYCIPYHELHMREAGSQTRDSIVKNKLFMDYIEGKYNVTLVVDDRDQVVNMWREKGIETWQVANGAF